MKNNNAEYKKVMVQYLTEAAETIAGYNNHAKGRSKIMNKELVADLAKCGERYMDSPIRLMVIGRAAGRISEEPEKWLNDTDGPAYYVDLARQDHLEWLREAKGKGSKRICKRPFYKLVGDVMCELMPEEAQKEDGMGWTHYIARTNFYDITYFNSATNPNKALIQAQHPIMLRMMECDLSYFKPTHILVITGGDWPEAKKFQDFMKMIDVTKEKNCKVAVTGRPEFKSCEEMQEMKNNIWRQFQINQ